MRRYLRTCVAAFLAGLLLLATVNALVDPYGCLPSPVFPGWNVPKSEAVHYARLSKAYAVRRVRPRALVLGASPALAGYDPGHPGWRARPVYNLALPGAGLYELRRHLEHALALAPVEQVVLGLDFAQFNVHFDVRADFDERRLCSGTNDRTSCPVPVEWFGVLLSADTLQSSAKTLWRNLSGDPTQVAFADGRFDWRDGPRWVHAFGGYRKVFAYYTKGFLWAHWFPPPARRFELRGEDGEASPLDELGRILEIARRHRIDLRLAISPSHAYLTEAAHAAGLWPLFGEWLRELTERLEAEAKRAGAEPFPLWDFTGYGPWTGEDVPDRNDPATTMRWYVDPSHFTRDLGNLVLDRVLGRQGEAAGLADFGFRVSAANVGEDLARIRDERERYRHSHPDEVAEIEEWARRAAEARGHPEVAQLSG
jgi:hypothetical protein